MGTVISDVVDEEPKNIIRDVIEEPPGNIITDSFEDSEPGPPEAYNPVSRPGDAGVYEAKDTVELFPPEQPPMGQPPGMMLKGQGFLPGNYQPSLPELGGVAEAGAAAVTGSLAAMGGGLAAMSATALYKASSILPFVDWGESSAADIFMSTYRLSEHFTYQPRTAEGEKYLENTFGQIEQLGTMMGQEATDFVVGLGTVGDIDLTPGAQGWSKLTPEQSNMTQEGQAELAATVGAAARLLPDLSLMLLGVKAVEVVGKVKSARIEKGVKGKLREAGVESVTETPVGELAKFEMRWTSLKDLPVTKPLMNKAQINKMVRDITEGSLEPDIAVEVGPGGIPELVTSGERTLLAFRAMEEKGMPVPQTIAVRAMPRKYTETEVGEINRLAASRTGKFLRDKVAEKEGAEALGKQLSRAATVALIDQSGPIKKVLNKFGALGKVAVRRFNIAAGSTPRSHMYFQDARRMIFDTRSADNPALSWRRDVEFRAGETAEAVRLSERDLFNMVVEDRQLTDYRYRGTTRKKDVDPDIQAARARLAKVEEAVGRPRFANMLERSDAYFESVKRSMDRAVKYGIMTKGRAKLITRREKSKPEGAFNPEDFDVAFDIDETGLYKPDKGQARVHDVETKLAEIIVRTESRIARNYRDNALYDLANSGVEGIGKLVKEVKKNEEGKFPQAPEGYTAIKLKVKGKTKVLHMDKTMAEYWNGPDTTLTNNWIMSTTRMLAGSSLVKPLATGYNPGFAITNMTVDLVHAWRTSEVGFSSWGPVYLGEIITDLAATFKDAFARKGAYRQFVEEGGATAFLTSQGKGVLMAGEGLSAQIAREVRSTRKPWRQNIESAKKVLSYVNETSEIWVRLAIRNRGLKNGMSSEEATAAARDYLDFSQGGIATKYLDNWIPYLNASTQGMRTALRAYKNNPKSTAIKDMQLIGPYLAWQTYQWYKNPEFMNQMTAQQDRDFVNFELPGATYTDPSGNKRLVYLKFKKDQSILPMLMIPQLMVNRALGNRVPGDSVLNYLRALTPITQNPFPPTTAAISAWMLNKDVWREADAWRGTAGKETGVGKILPGAEFTPGVEPQALVDLGKTFPSWFSPARGYAALRTLAPTNSYLQFGWNLYNYIDHNLNGDPEIKREIDDMREQSFLAWLSQNPAGNRFLGLTHPGPNTYDRMDEASIETATREKLWDDEVRVAMKNMQLATSETKKKQIMDDLQKSAAVYGQQTFRPDLPAKIVLTGIAKDAARRVHARLNDPYLESVAGPLWWSVLSATSDPAMRADKYFWIWKDVDADRRKKLDRMLHEVDAAGAISTGSRGIYDAGFVLNLNKLKKQWGTDQAATLDPPDDGE